MKRKMKEIYKEYFQKSTTFLYPMLGMKKSKTPKPRQTYISWGDDIHYTDRKLVVLYDREDSDQWKRFEANILMTHPMLMDSVIVSDEQIIYIFNFDVPEYREDFDNFINGQYSQFSNNAKKKITDYFGIQSPEWIFIESYIHPKKYFQTYADILEVEVATIQKAGELCDKFNSEKEKCTVLINQLTNIKN
jgi:hypothetical protein